MVSVSMIAKAWLKLYSSYAMAASTVAARPVCAVLFSLRALVLLVGTVACVHDLVL